MKTILVLTAFLSLSAGAFAQHRISGFHGGGYSAPRVIVAPSIGYRIGVGYPLGYPYYGYGYPYGAYRPMYGSRGYSSKLELQIQSIKLDYQNQIRNTRHDKSLSHSERRADIRNLKNEKEQAIISAQENFRNRRTNYPGRSLNNNQNGNQNNSNSGTNNENNQSGNNSNDLVQ